MESVYINLPMPPSINAMHGFAGRGKVIFRSDKYNDWMQYAGIAWRNQFPSGTELLTGRLRTQYLFVFNNDRDQDINNREKCLSDFLQKKIFVNDSQIDESHHMRRIRKGVDPYVECWITEIEDMRQVSA